MIDNLYITRLDLFLDGHAEIRLAALVDANWVGTVHGVVHGQTMTLYQLFVPGVYRGLGIGTALVQHMEAEACRPKSGVQAVSAIVEKSGPLGFWQHLGYEPVHGEQGKIIVSKRLE